ncbi:MAG: NUDIX hydrolase [Bacillota bacterium]
MTREVSAGGVVYRRGPQGDAEVLMIMDSYSRWTFPKGIVEAGETPEEAAVREIGEETSVTGRIEASLGETNYRYHGGPRGFIDKTVHYFLVRTDERAAAKPLPGEVKETRWCGLDEAMAISAYANNREILAAAVELIKDKMAGGGKA